MEDIPGYVSATFVAIVIAVLGFIYYGVSTSTSGKKSIVPPVVVTILIGWIFFVSLQTFNGFFTNLSGIPRLPLFVGIPMLTIFILLIVPKTRAVLMNMPITTLHYLHIIRVPVEMVLWWLAVSRAIPIDMTFEGSNFDIISGISAPFAAVFLVGTRSQNRVGAIVWNVVALGLLINIVATAISYLPYFFTPTGGEVANLGVFYFPYVLLPTFVVPAVFFSHLVSLCQLICKKDQSQF